MDTKNIFENLFATRDYNTCEVCGNHYDKCMQLRVNGELHVFDCFECAVHALAPTCAHCGCRIVGHGLETDSVFFCCANCAEEHGLEGFQDRIKQPEERKTG